MNKKFALLTIVVFLIFFVLSNISEFYLDYQWFKMYDKLDTFWILFFSKFNIHLLFSFIFAILFLLNFGIMRLTGGKQRIFTSHIMNTLHIPIFKNPKNALLIILLAITIVTSYILGLSASTYWKEILMYINKVAFNGSTVDPIFKNNISFYLFSLPVYKFFYNWLLFSLIVIIIFSVIFHVLNGGILITETFPNFSLFSRAHLTFLLALIIILYGASFRISQLELLFAKRGKFFGAGFTDVNAQLTAYYICMFFSFIAAILLFISIFKKKFKLPFILILSIIPVYFVFGTIYPSLQQRFIVEPNELEKEYKYIENNITFTRMAYGINNLKEKRFPNTENLNYQQIIDSKSIINNIRLWDWRPLKNTFKQLQELKPYYHFFDVDVDRYTINNKKVTVNLSARELFTSKLSFDSQTWINKHLIYTHGYGIVMNQVNKISEEGLPEMLIKDIPPKTSIDLSLKRPEIYFGEHNNPYIITNTKIEPGEFDYPYGETNKYTTYKGSGGIKLDSFFKRLLFSIAFGDINILISSNITNESKIIYRRNINKIANSLTPFLEFDHDPYIVIDNGNLYWIIDGYTTSNKFPYSTPEYFKNSQINYIRNSIKVVIDAYNGNIQYYISDEKDPIINTYKNIFPELFTSITKMPKSLKEHIRYPEELFKIQSNVLLRYHMTNVNVFYNNEDAWSIPNQIYETQKEIMQPYYIVTQLPGETNAEYILMLPFTPLKKDNMIGFFIAKCDPENYGDLVLYRLPKEKLSYGPMQLEARINQDQEISKLLTLWGQKGSKVLRGNMLAIPIMDSLLFIEPLYLKSESSEIPELKKVIVSFADKIVIETNLNLALEKMFQGKSFDKIFNLSDKNIDNKTKKQFSEYANKAYSYFIKAEAYQRNGEWAKYGNEIKKLKNILKLMKNMK